MVMFYDGTVFISTDLMVLPHPDGLEDWSRVRSPGRARRRRAKHRQNIVPVMVPDPKMIRMGNKVYGHPVTIQQLIDAINSFEAEKP